MNVYKNLEEINGELTANSIVNGDCLEVMKLIPDKSIDAIITDPPFGTTSCKWDSVIPFDLMWEQLNRIIKPNGAIVLFGTQPFTSSLVMSNPKWFKYCWVWEKVRPVGHLVVKYRPMQKTEDICVFGSGRITYNPQMTLLDKEKIEVYKAGGKRGSCVHMAHEQKADYVKISNSKYPSNVLNYSSIQGFHPTQKPVPLLEYLIKTYTNEYETVLDFTMGSGTTCVAAKQTNRKFIGIEMDKTYFDIANKRITEILL